MMRIYLEQDAIPRQGYVLEVEQSSEERTLSLSSLYFRLTKWHEGHEIDSQANVLELVLRVLRWTCERRWEEVPLEVLFRFLAFKADVKHSCHPPNDRFSEEELAIRFQGSWIEEAARAAEPSFPFDQRVYTHSGAPELEARYPYRDVALFEVWKGAQEFLEKHEGKGSIVVEPEHVWTIGQLPPITLFWQPGNDETERQLLYRIEGV